MYLNWLKSTRLSFHPCLGIPSDIFPSGFPTKILNIFFYCHIHSALSRPPLSSWSDHPSDNWKGVQIVTPYIVGGIYFIKLKRPHIFHNKGLASYPVLRKGPYHIPNMTTKLSAVRAISCQYVLDNFQNYMSFVNRRRKNLTLQNCRFVWLRSPVEDHQTYRCAIFFMNLFLPSS